MLYLIPLLNAEQRLYLHQAKDSLHYNVTEKCSHLSSQAKIHVQHVLYIHTSDQYVPFQSLATVAGVDF